jgi:hypothetical protein
MVDYGKLIDEEKTRRDSALSFVEAKGKKDAELKDYFAVIENDLGKEVAAVNQELEKRGSPTISGPLHALSSEEKTELAFGTRNPACRLTLQSTQPKVGLSRIHVELFDEDGVQIGQTDFVIEGEAANLKTYKSLVEGFPDYANQVGPEEIAQGIVAGILRGRFS